jgi:UDP-2,4-diacetamido-2,4,6-trideoxy-beta-L-altropyranose hydrolase
MKVVFITEGNTQAGYGHLTRCISICQGFEELGLSPTFIVNCDEGGKKVLGDVPITVFDWVENTDDLIEHIEGSDIAIVDSYLADLSVYKSIYHSVKKTVYLDDNMRLTYPPGMIVNGTVNAEKLPYKRDGAHTFLLGLQYTPLRKAFWDSPRRTPRGEMKNVLITIGGGGFEELTFQILEALTERFPQLNYHVVLGFGATTDSNNGIAGNVYYYRSLSANKMLDLMLSCDIAISAAGQTSYELVRTETPSIFIQVVDNQKNNIRGWFEIGVIRETIISDKPGYIAQILDSISEVGNSKINLRESSNSTLNVVNGILNTHG